MEDNLKKYELTINENEDSNLGVFAISVVTEPAIEQCFVMMSKQTDIEPTFFANNDEQIITGPALIPDKLIYRKKNNYEYNVFMSSNTIKQIAIKFFKKNFNNNTTLEHTDKINNTTYFESWIVDDVLNDKKNAEKYNNAFIDVPQGSWMVSLKIQDKNLWKTIKKNGFTGFSIEGIFDDELVENSKQEATKNKEQTMSKNKNFIQKLKSFFSDIEKEFNFEDVKLKDGSTVSIDDQGNVTVSIDGEPATPAKDGDYELEDGTTLTVKDGKKVEATVSTDTTAAAQDASTAGETKVEAKQEIRYSALVTLEDKSAITIDDTMVARKDDGSILPDGDYTLITGDVLSVKDGMVQKQSEAADDATDSEDDEEMNKVLVEAKTNFSKIKSELEVSLSKVTNLEAEVTKLKAEIVELGSKPASKGIGHVNTEVKELSLADRVTANIKRMNSLK